MGRHVEASGTALDPRRTAPIAGLTGGISWVFAFFLPDGGALETTVLWAGAILLTVALFGLGLLLVRSDVLALRVFVALALPTLVWGVFGRPGMDGRFPRLGRFGRVLRPERSTSWRSPRPTPSAAWR
jgi:hypothetical protein